MDLQEKRNASETAEQGRIRAEADTMRKAFLKSCAIALAAIISILGLSSAWFVSNTNVSGSGNRVSVNDGRTFYLATRYDDKQGIYDSNPDGAGSLWQALNKYQRINKGVNTGNQNISFQGLPQFMVGTTVVTASDGKQYIVGDTDGISLMVNSTSNVNNDTAQNAYIGPGSRGELTFYIIPIVDGLSQASFTVSLAACKVTDSKDSADSNVTARAEMIDASDANSLLRGFLCGHMLLFIGKDGNGDYVNQIFPELGADGSILFPFEVKGENWAINQPVKITLYWVWPYRFENLVYAGQRNSVFRTFGSAQENFLSWVKGNREFIVHLDDPRSLEEPGTGMSNAGLSQWNAGYNRADQLIGDTVAYFVWTISTQN